MILPSGLDEVQEVANYYKSTEELIKELADSQLKREDQRAKALLEKLKGDKEND